MSTIRFPQRNLSPESNNWARSIEENLQYIAQALKEQRQATQQALSNAGWAITTGVELGDQLWLTRKEVEKQESKIESVEADMAAEAPPMYWETYRPDGAPGQGGDTTVFVPSNPDSVWYVIDLDGNILEVWRWVPGYDAELEIDMGEWVQERFNWDTLSEDVREVVEEVRLDIEAINDFNKDVVDPFIQNTDEKLTIDLPAAQQAAQDAQADAIIAMQQANGLIWLSPEEPPLEARVEGQVWMKTDYEGRLTGMYRLDDPSVVPPQWQTYTIISGVFIVPSEDGTPTVIDQNGVTVGNIAADSIGSNEIMANSIGAKQLIIGEIELTRENLDPITNEILTEAQEWANRVVIGPQDITISRSPIGSENQLTSMKLSATRLQFTVGNEPVAHIDSTRGQLLVQNAMIEEALQVGEHQVRTIGSNITIFAWNPPTGD